MNRLVTFRLLPALALFAAALLTAPATPAYAEVLSGQAGRLVGRWDVRTADGGTRDTRLRIINSGTATATVLVRFYDHHAAGLPGAPAMVGQRQLEIPPLATRELSVRALEAEGVMYLGIETGDGTSRHGAVDIQVVQPVACAPMLTAFQEVVFARYPKVQLSAESSARAIDLDFDLPEPPSMKGLNSRLRRNVEMCHRDADLAFLGCTHDPSLGWMYPSPLDDQMCLDAVNYGLMTAEGDAFELDDCCHDWGMYDDCYEYAVETWGNVDAANDCYAKAKAAEAACLQWSPGPKQVQSAGEVGLRAAACDQAVRAERESR